MKHSLDLDALIETCADAVVVCDLAGNISLWNPAATRVFGFSEDEALGKSLDIIIPERLRKRHWDGYHVTMKSGETKYGSKLLQVPALHKDGRSLSIAFTVSLIRDVQGVVTGITSVIRDETERFENERALKKRLLELESKHQVILSA